MVKVTGLTRLNIEALKEAFPVSVGQTLHLTATTASFDCPAERASLTVAAAILRLGGKQHPGKSLWAVKRKLDRQIDNSIGDAGPFDA